MTPIMTIPAMILVAVGYKYFRQGSNISFERFVVEAWLLTFATGIIIWVITKNGVW